MEKGKDGWVVLEILRTPNLTWRPSRIDYGWLNTIGHCMELSMRTGPTMHSEMLADTYGDISSTMVSRHSSFIMSTESTRTTSTCRVCHSWVLISNFITTLSSVGVVSLQLVFCSIFDHLLYVPQRYPQQTRNYRCYLNPNNLNYSFNNFLHWTCSLSLLSLYWLFIMLLAININF